jgi:glyoxylase-like metal-dependent hydrolase (beta-lactamase superfamily II)
MNEIVLGDVGVTRVVEYYGPVDLSPATFFPELPQQAWPANEPWLAPDFVHPADDVCVSAIQTWVLRSEGKNVLVDTGVGNDKERPNSPVWDHLNTEFLTNLARAGIQPEDVDLVVNTHLHVDHVGWNTRLDGDTWVPTFPNATYLMPRADFDFWNPVNGDRDERVRLNSQVFKDSVAPVYDAEQTLLWEGRHDIDANLTLELAPGHTPGSSVLRLQSGADRALFVGDLLHNPAQVLYPNANSCFCVDPDMARASRSRLLGEAADANELVLPAHFGGHGGTEVIRDHAGFAIKAWAPFARL